MNRTSGRWPILLLAAAMLLAGAAGAADRGISVAGPGAVHTGAWGTYHALIIGINDYQQWPRLRTAVKDATVLSQVLVDRYGFDKDRVILRTDAAATRRQITADIRALATSMKPDDNLLIYYAGHGQLDDLTGDGYWIPAEGEANNPSSWIANSYLKAVFSSEKVAAKNVVVIADSCYSGTMLRGGPSLMTLDGDYKTKLRQAAAKRSRQVISSGGIEPVADGGAEGHSLFAFYFITALKENDREVMDLENLFHTRVWKPVSEIGGQRPSVGRLKTPMDRDGQFVLYNQAWVEQQRRAEENRRREAERRAEEAAARKQRAVAADQMAAIQAERQRMELERQKLAMEKELMAQRQALELEKLNLARLTLEREKQQMALEAEQKKLEVERAGLKQTDPAPIVASVSTAVIDTKKLALLPFKFNVNKQFAGSAILRGAIEGIVYAASRSDRVALAFSCYENDALPIGTRLVKHLNDRDDIWVKESFFAKPEPNPEAIREIGQELQADLVVLVNLDHPGTIGGGILKTYLVDVKTGKIYLDSRKSESLSAPPKQGVASATLKLIDQFRINN